MAKDYFGPIEEEEVPEKERPWKSKFHDLVGKRFGKWTVSSKAKTGYWCTCDCGVIRKLSHGALVTFKSTQCITCNRREKRSRKVESRRIQELYG